MSNFKKLLISAFIVFNFLTMVRVHLPLRSPFMKVLYTPIDRYLSFFSIYQDWMMFSPNPGRFDSYLTAKIKFSDGTFANYDFPRPARMKLVDNHINGEKFRKIISESIRRDDHKYMWHDTAKFALRKSMKEQNFLKMPLEVKLFRHWDEVPLIHEKFRPHNDRALVYQKFNFYTYKVNQ